jgi:hypothetical protein
VGGERVWEAQAGGLEPEVWARINPGQIPDASRRWRRTVDEYSLAVGAKEYSQRAPGKKPPGIAKPAHPESRRRVDAQRLRSPKPHLPADRSGSGWC